MAGREVKSSKCFFAVKRVEFLGHEVSALGMGPNCWKVEAIQSFSRPVDLKVLRPFLGKSSYYRRFIEDYAIIAESLINKIRREIRVDKWTRICLNAAEKPNDKIFNFESFRSRLFRRNIYWCQCLWGWGSSQTASEGVGKNTDICQYNFISNSKRI